MKKLKSIRPIFLSAVMCLFMFWASASGGESSFAASAELLPPETVGLVNIRDFSVLEEQFKKTSFYKLYNAPSMGEFVKSSTSKWREGINKQDNSIFQAILEPQVYPEGRLTFAFMLKAEGEQMSQSFIVISQWGSKINEIKEALSEFSEKSVSAGSHKKSEEYREVGIVTLIKELPAKEVPDYSNFDGSESDKPAMKTYQPEPQEINYCFVEDCLIASDDIESVKFVIAHIKGASSPSLSGESDYTNMMKAVGPYHDIDFYVNIQQLIKVLAAGDSSGRSKAMVSNLGLDNISSFSCSLGVGREKRASLKGKAFLRAAGSKKGILKVLDFDSSGLSLPRFVPSSVSSVAVINLDIPHAFEEVSEIVSSFSPQAGAMLYAPLVPGGPGGEGGVQLQRDIISHLGSRIIITSDVQQAEGEGSEVESQSYLLVSLEDRRSLEKSLSRLHEKLLARGEEDSRRELLGHTIYLLEPGGFFPWFLQRGPHPMQSISEEKSEPPSTMAFTVTDTHLILGKESAVESAIRAISSKEIKSLDSAQWFLTAKGSIPAMVGFASLKNRAATSKILWEQMKKAAASKEESGLQAGVGISSGNFPFITLKGEMFNYSLLPSFDEVHKYFGVSAYYGKSRADGLFIEFKYFNPPGTE